MINEEEQSESQEKRNRKFERNREATDLVGLIDSDKKTKTKYKN